MGAVGRRARRDVLAPPGLAADYASSGFPGRLTYGVDHIDTIDFYGAWHDWRSLGLPAALRSSSPVIVGVDSILDMHP